jgi:integrase
MPNRIGGFLGRYSSSTRNGYQSSIVAFFSMYGFKREGKRISAKEKEELELLADKYFLENRDYEGDLIAFSKYCDSIGLAITTKAYYITGIKEFYIFNNVELTIKQERNLHHKIPRGDPVSFEEELDKEMIRKILNSADLKLKTIIMMQISSGCRVGEILSLTDSSIKLFPDHGILYLKGNKTKNKKSRISFINKETVELLNQWIDYRNKYIQGVVGRSRGRFQVNGNTNKIFPFSLSNAENCFRRVLKKAGMFKKDEDTDRCSIHYHMLRKYFVTNLSYSGIDSVYIDMLVGHTNKLVEAYNKPTTQKFYEIYSKGEPYLRIFDDSVEEITSLKSTVDKNKDEVRDLKLDNIDMRLKLQNVDKLEKELAEMKAIVMQLSLNAATGTQIVAKEI